MAKVSSMNVCTFSVILGFLLVTVGGQGNRLTYNDLKNINASCAPLDTCSGSREKDTLSRYRCQCKSACVKFDTCCIDAPDRAPITTSIHNRRRSGTCKEIIRNVITALVVDKCNNRWRGRALIKSQCESPPKDYRDPLSITPVTSLETEITYSNYFCAVCNDDEESLQYWDLKLSHFDPFYIEELLQGKDESAIFDYLKFNNATGKWEIEVKDEDGNVDTEEMDVGFSFPENLKDVVVPCVPGIVSECHRSWKDEDVRKKCNAYMALIYLKPDVRDIPGEVYADPIPYRNIHCAVCNFETYSKDTICLSYKYTPYANPSMSFTILLDVNLNDGKTVGVVNPCKSGQIYDKFFKRCRNLVCGLPGYVMKNGKCHPPS